MKSGHDWFKYCDALWDHPSGNKWQFFWLLEQLINCKIPSSAIHLSFTVKCLLLLSTTHSQLLMANPKLLGTENAIPGKKPRIWECWICGGPKSNMLQTRMTEASRDHTDLSQHFPGAAEPLVELSLHLTTIWSQSCTSRSLSAHCGPLCPVKGGSFESRTVWERSLRNLWRCFGQTVLSPAVHSTHWMAKDLTENKAVLFI